MALSETSVKPSKAPKKKYVQERMMALLTLAFVGGVIIYTFAPEGQFRGMAIGLFSIAMTWLLFRFGL